MNYLESVETINNGLSQLIEEIIFLQQTQTAILRNDNYLIKDKETQAVFESLLCNYQQKIHPNNHMKGYDIKHLGNKISIKSGTVNNGLLTFSYSRTTEHKTLEDKINYLSSFDNLIVGLASEKIKTDNPNVIAKVKYHLYHFPANQIDLKKMKWEEHENCYFGEDEETKTVVDIKKKMSDQPWITLPLANVTHHKTITFCVSSLHGRKYLVIHREDTGERLHFDMYQHRNKIKQLEGLQKCSSSTKKALMD